MAATHAIESPWHPEKGNRLTIDGRLDAADRDKRLQVRATAETPLTLVERIVKAINSALLD